MNGCYPADQTNPPPAPLNAALILITVLPAFVTNPNMPTVERRDQVDVWAKIIREKVTSWKGGKVGGHCGQATLTLAQ